MPENVCSGPNHESIMMSCRSRAVERDGDKKRSKRLAFSLASPVKTFGVRRGRVTKRVQSVGSSVKENRMDAATGAHMQIRPQAIWCVQRRRRDPAVVDHRASWESRQRAKSCMERASSWDCDPKLHRSSRTTSKQIGNGTQAGTKVPNSKDTANSLPVSTRREHGGGGGDDEARPGDAHSSHAKQDADRAHTIHGAQVHMRSRCHTLPLTRRSSIQRRYGSGANDCSTERPSWRSHSIPWAQRSSQQWPLQQLPGLRLLWLQGREFGDEPGKKKKEE